MDPREIEALLDVIAWDGTRLVGTSWPAYDWLFEVPLALKVAVTLGQMRRALGQLL